MGLTNSVSFAAGSAAAAAAHYEKPTASITAWSTSNSQVLYTVPSGKYFKGNIIHTQYQYPPYINDKALYKYINIDENAESYNNYMSHEFRLYAGDVIKSGTSGQGNGGTKVQGMEFDL